jgi:Ni,Fe-hydrogenase III large subunit
MRLIARFAKEQKECFEIITVYDKRIIKERVNKITPVLVSIAKEYASASWFERKITDDFGIEILCSTDKRPLVKHEHFSKDIFPMRKSFLKLSIDNNESYSLEPLENHGVILGPTQPYHAESSQFQLFDRKKEILHFEAMPFYKYRGIEKMVEGMSLEEAKPIIERISGTSSIAYQLAYLEIQLQASKKKLPLSLQRKNIYFLEFERIINHLSDLGLMCRFIHFNEGFSFFMKLVEEARESMKTLTGHRFGFSAIDMNSNTVEFEKGDDFLRHLENELLWFEKWLNERPSFWRALVQRGLLTKEDAVNFGLVGLVARAVDIELDRRTEETLYKKHGFVLAQESIGDSSSRFKIRLTEIHTSLRMMRRVFNNKVLPFFPGTYTNGEYYAYIESSGGELMMYMEIIDEKIERFFVRDPSFLNAQILSRCVRGNEMDALGLIVKSIPLSFSANDL